MDVCHQRNRDALGPQAGLYSTEGLHLAQTLGGEPDQLRAGLVKFPALGDCGVYVVGVAVAHTLYDSPAGIVSYEQVISYICSDIAHI